MATLIAVIRTIIDEMIAVLIGSHITTGVTVGHEWVSMFTKSGEILFFAQSFWPGPVSSKIDLIY